MPSVVSLFPDIIQDKEYNRSLYNNEKEEQGISEKHFPAANLVQLEKVDNPENHKQMIKQGR